MIRFVLTAALLAILPLTSGCFLAPFIQSFKEVGATSGDRERLLGKEIKAYSELLSWGKASEAANYATPEFRDLLFSQIRDVGEKEKVFDTKIKDVVYSNDAYDAVVEAEVQYYRVPYYVVVRRKEEQLWTFNLSSGWKLKGRKIQEETRQS